MSKVLTAAALAVTLVAGSGVAAQAATTSQLFFGPIKETGTTKQNTTGSFTSLAYTFTAPYLVTGITFSDSSGRIKFGNLSISGTTYTANAGKNPFFFAFNLGVKVKAGDTLTIAGTAPRGGSGFNGNIAVSAVPLPTTVALFGTAVMGLGFAGAIRRKGQKAAVSAA